MPWSSRTHRLKTQRDMSQRAARHAPPKRRSAVRRGGREPPFDGSRRSQPSTVRAPGFGARAYGCATADVAHAHRHHDACPSVSDAMRAARIAQSIAGATAQREAWPGTLRISAWLARLQPQRQ
jgi:hypothetical protein